MTDRDLDTELRRLFGDERLDVRPSEDAPTRIIAGARRVRRRRAALTASGGALTLVVLVSVGLVFGQLRSTQTDTAASGLQPTLSATLSSVPDSPIPLNPIPGSSSSGETSGSTAQTSAPQTSTWQSPPSSAQPSSTRSQSAPLLSGSVLGPTGYSKLVLGMSFADAKTTGLLADAGTAPNGCADYTLAEGTARIHNVTISDTNGIVSFEAGGARTPERIGVGSTKDELVAAYPGASKTGGEYSAPAGSGDGSYRFQVGDGDRVTGLLLVGPATC